MGSCSRQGRHLRRGSRERDLHVFENLKGDQFVWKMVGKEKAKISLETLWAKQKRSNSKHCYGDYRLRLTSLLIFVLN